MFLGVVDVSAQKDSISIEARLSSDEKTLTVNQELVYYNHSEKDLNTVKLLNWISAYHKRGTSLAYRKLEDRNTDLHFAKDEQLGKLLSLQIKSSGQEIPVQNLSDENLFLPLQQTLKPGEKIKLQLQYQMQLPDKKFTGYGISDNSIALKYFFIVPDHFDPDNISSKKYHDIEESVNFNTFWNISLTSDTKYYIQSNISRSSNGNFTDDLDTDPEFILSKKEFPVIKVNSEDLNTEIKFGYPLNPQEKENLEFFSLSI